MGKLDKKIQEIREAHAKEENFLLKYPTSSSRKAHEYIGYLLQQIDQVGEIRESLDVLKQQMIEQRNYTAKLKKQIEIKDKALKEAETFVEELILAADTVPASHLDLEEIAKDGTDVINSIEAALKGEDTP